MTISMQILYLFAIAIPIACVTWTVTHEAIFREFNDLCVRKCTTSRRLYARKFFYLFTCEYCFSHYVTAAFLVITRYRLLFPDWRGYLIAGLSLVWVANVYMALFGKIRLDLRKERVEIAAQETASAPSPALVTLQR
jgi:hypothetical protein